MTTRHGHSDLRGSEVIVRLPSPCARTIEEGDCIHNPSHICSWVDRGEVCRAEAGSLMRHFPRTRAEEEQVWADARRFASLSPFPQAAWNKWMQSYRRALRLQQEQQQQRRADSGVDVLGRLLQRKQQEEVKQRQHEANQTKHLYQQANQANQATLDDSLSQRGQEEEEAAAVDFITKTLAQQRAAASGMQGPGEGEELTSTPNVPPPTPSPTSPTEQQEAERQRAQLVEAELQILKIQSQLKDELFQRRQEEARFEYERRLRRLEQELKEQGEKLRDEYDRTLKQQRVADMKNVKEREEQALKAWQETERKAQRHLQTVLGKLEEEDEKRRYWEQDYRIVTSRIGGSASISWITKYLVQVQRGNVIHGSTGATWQQSNVILIDIYSHNPKEPLGTRWMLQQIENLAQEQEKQYRRQEFHSSVIDEAASSSSTKRPSARSEPTGNKVVYMVGPLPEQIDEGLQDVLKDAGFLPWPVNETRISVEFWRTTLQDIQGSEETFAWLKGRLIKPLVIDEASAQAGSSSSSKGFLVYDYNDDTKAVKRGIQWSHGQTTALVQGTQQLITVSIQRSAEGIDHQAQLSGVFCHQLVAALSNTTLTERLFKMWSDRELTPVACYKGYQEAPIVAPTIEEEKKPMMRSSSESEPPSWSVFTEYLGDWWLPISSSTSRTSRHTAVHPIAKKNAVLSAIRNLALIHDQGIAHGDIAGHNVLVRYRFHNHLNQAFVKFINFADGCPLSTRTTTLPTTSTTVCVPEKQQDWRDLFKVLNAYLKDTRRLYSVDELVDKTRLSPTDQKELANALVQVQENAKLLTGSKSSASSSSSSSTV